MSEPIHRAIGEVLVAIDEITPEAPDLRDSQRATDPRTSKVSGVMVAAASFVVVMIVGGVAALGLRSEATPPGTGSEPVTTDAVVTTTVHSTTTTVGIPTDLPPAAPSDFTIVRVDPTSDDLVGLRNFQVQRSTDGGETWVHQRGELGRQIEVLDVAPDGSIVAVENPNDILRDVLGPNSSANPTPIVHLYEPSTGEWTATELPRPDLPFPGLEPASIDGSGDCELGGLQSWVDAHAVAWGDRIVIAGAQFVVADGMCGETFPFFWQSLDGITWQVIEDTGTALYITGLVALGDRYIAYGTTYPYTASVNHRDPVPSVRFLESVDLVRWDDIDLDLGALPSDALLIAPPATSGNPGTYAAGQISRSSDGTAISLPVVAITPLPDASIPDVESLAAWLTENRNGAPLSAEEIAPWLDEFGVDFPLDDDEAHLIASFWESTEHRGRLVTVRLSDGTWHTTFESVK